MGSDENKTRLLWLTLDGDKDAALALKKQAQRQQDRLLQLVADVVLQPMDWDRARGVLDKLPDDMAPEIRAHLHAKILKPRAYYSSWRLEAGLKEATLRLVTHLNMVTPLQGHCRWAIFLESPMDSLRVLEIKTPLPVKGLSEDSVGWLSRLYCVKIDALDALGVKVNDWHLWFNFLSKDKTETMRSLWKVSGWLSSAAMPSLRQLVLTRALITPSDMKRLLNAPWMGQIQKLSFRNCHMEAGAFELLASADHLRSLRTLDIKDPASSRHDGAWCTWIDTSVFVMLAGAAFWKNLRNIVANGLTNAAIDALMTLHVDRFEDRLILLSLGYRPRGYYLSERPFVDATRECRETIGTQFSGQLEGLAKVLEGSTNEPKVRGAMAAVSCILDAVDAGRVVLGREDQRRLAEVAVAHAPHGLDGQVYEKILGCVQDFGLRVWMTAKIVGEKIAQCMLLKVGVRVQSFQDQGPNAEAETALEQQLFLSILFSGEPYAGRLARKIVLGKWSDAQREAFVPWVWRVLEDLEASGPGERMFNGIAWPRVKCVDGGFKLLWALSVIYQDEGALLRLFRLANQRPLRSVGFLHKALIKNPNVIMMLFKTLNCCERDQLIKYLGNHDPKILPYFVKNRAARAACPPWNEDCPYPAQSDVETRASWEELAYLNLVATVQMTQGASSLLRNRLDALLPTTSPYFQTIIQNFLDK